MTSIQDGFPKWVKRHLVCHEMLVLLVCVISFLFGLPNISQVSHLASIVHLILKMFCTREKQYLPSRYKKKKDYLKLFFKFKMQDYELLLLYVIMRYETALTIFR